VKIGLFIYGLFRTGVAILRLYDEKAPGKRIEVRWRYVNEGDGDWAIKDQAIKDQAIKVYSCLLSKTNHSKY